MPLTSFVGRARQVTEVQARVLAPDVRLLTLTGPGGVGKTRLALEVMRHVAGAFADGARLVSLAPLADPALVLPAVAHALGVPETGDHPLLETVVAVVRERCVLLVLDNCEHVAAAAPLVPALLGACPQLRILATSRSPLRVSGEHEYPVLPLAVPPPALPAQGTAGVVPAPGTCGALAVDDVARNDAVRLFLDRARAVRPAFVLTRENAATVAELCRRLDGLPLALELAAARVRVLSPAALLARLEQRLDVLVGGARDLPGRQQTLRATIAWSHELLDPAERVLFHRLAVFAGPFTLEAAAAIAPPGGVLPPPVLDGVTSLVEKSLLRTEEAPSGAPRFAMLETVRAYAQERLVASGEAAAVAAGHAAFFLEEAETAATELRGAQQLAWLARLDDAHEDVRTALRWYVERGAAGDADATERGLRLAGALGGLYWYLRAHFREGRAWLGALLGLPAAAARTAGRARALVALAILSTFAVERTATASLCREGLQLAREAGDRRTTADALTWLSYATADAAAAQAHLEEAHAIARALDDRYGVALVCWYLGGLHRGRGERATARAAFEEGLAAARSIGERMGTSLALIGLAGLARDAGALREARERYEEALALRRALGAKREVAFALYFLGQVAQAQGDVAGAQAAYREALALRRETGDLPLAVSLLERLAALALDRDAPALALRLAGAAAAATEDAPVRPWRVAAADLEHLRRAAGRVIGTAGAALWMAGRALSLEEAIDDALVLTNDPAPTVFPPGPSPEALMTPHRRSPPGGSGAGRPALPEEVLTRREQEVAALVARGLTNRQIAAALVITEGTAANHVEHIREKLGVRSRAQVTAWVVTRGL